jgi:hypothetical protein
MGDKIEDALAVAFENGNVEGEHHKQWVIDQMVRALLGPEYSVWVERHNADNASKDYPPWDIGTAP